jgi:hypothetical protein
LKFTVKTPTHRDINHLSKAKSTAFVDNSVLTQVLTHK